MNRLSGRKKGRSQEEAPLSWEQYAARLVERRLRGDYLWEQHCEIVVETALVAYTFGQLSRRRTRCVCLWADKEKDILDAKRRN